MPAPGAPLAHLLVAELVAALVAAPVAVPIAARVAVPVAAPVVAPFLPPSDEPTWAEIAPVVHRSCTVCHHATGPGPFVLAAPDDLAARAGFLGHVVERGLMPPWLPDERGLPLRDSLRLLPDERDRLLAWLAGAGRSDPATDASPDSSRDPVSDAAPAPDLVVAMARPWTIPAEGYADMRTFVLPVGNDQPLRLAGIGYRARSPRAVHTVTFLADALGIGRRLDAAADEPGYDAMGDVGAHVSGGTGAVGPGLPHLLLPPGFVFELPADADLLAEVHFLPRGRPEVIQDEVLLFLSDDPVARVVTSLWLADLHIDVPPGEHDHQLTDAIELPFAFDVVGLLPRAGAVCVALELSATVPGATTPTLLLSIPRWDPHYRRPYLLHEPLRLPAGTRLTASWRLDNSAANPANPWSPPQRVQLGARITDEYVSMLIWGAPVPPATDEDVMRFQLEQVRARHARR